MSWLNMLFHIIFSESICIYYTINSMRKILEKLASEQRRRMHEDIFVRNRSYRQMMESINQQNFKVIRLSNQVDPAYHNIIETLVRMRYDRNRMLELVDLLGHEEIVRVYEGMVGLSSFSGGIVNRETEDRLLESGVVSKLVKLVQMRDHPYLQLSSLELLINLAEAITVDNLWTYFNLTTIPFSLFHDTFRRSCVSSESAIKFFRILNRRSSYIETNDGNIPLLEAIEHQIPTSFSDVQARTGQELCFVIKLLNNMKISYQTGSRGFFNFFFMIKQRILCIYQQANMGEPIFSEMKLVCENRILQWILQVINFNQMEPLHVTDYIKDLIHAGFQVNRQNSSQIFSKFMSIIINSQACKYFLPHYQTFQLAEKIVLNNFNDQSSSQKIKVCIHIILKISSLRESNYLQFFLSRHELLNCLAKLYEIYEDKTIICDLNKIVRMLISNSYKKGVMEVLYLYKFIERYFKNCSRLNRMIINFELNSMRISIIILKKSNCQQQYEAIRREIVQKETYANFTKMKSLFYASQDKSIFLFYQRLKKEEQQATKQSSVPHQIFNQAQSNQQQSGSQGHSYEESNIQFSDQSDDLAHQ